MNLRAMTKLLRATLDPEDTLNPAWDIVFDVESLLAKGKTIAKPDDIPRMVEQALHRRLTRILGMLKP